jgi:hypothetical protein
MCSVRMTVVALKPTSFGPCVLVLPSLSLYLWLESRGAVRPAGARRTTNSKSSEATREFQAMDNVLDDANKSIAEMDPSAAFPPRHKHMTTTPPTSGSTHGRQSSNEYIPPADLMSGNVSAPSSHSDLSTTGTPPSLPPPLSSAL